jgi:hypothetical protein
MRKIFYGWWVTLAAFLTFGIAVGLPYYNMPFFYDYFQREFHWSKGQIRSAFHWRRCSPCGSVPCWCRA